VPALPHPLPVGTRFLGSHTRHCTRTIEMRLDIPFCAVLHPAGISPLLSLLDSWTLGRYSRTGQPASSLRPRASFFLLARVLPECPPCHIYCTKSVPTSLPSWTTPPLNRQSSVPKPLSQTKLFLSRVTKPTATERRMGKERKECRTSYPSLVLVPIAKPRDGTVLSFADVPSVPVSSSPATYTNYGSVVVLCSTGWQPAVRLVFQAQHLAGLHSTMYLEARDIRLYQHDRAWHGVAGQGM
jgi:hypothetical protein